MTVRITVPSDKLAAFCERWQIVELAIFGSILRDDRKAISTSWFHSGKTRAIRFSTWSGWNVNWKRFSGATWIWLSVPISSEAETTCAEKPSSKRPRLSMRRSEILFLDMLLSAREAVEMAEGLTFSSFEGNRTVQLAVLKAVETVGEAAARVDAGTRERHPEIPWADITGMRNRLVHEYFRVNLTRVWETVKRDIPVLISQLEALVPPESK